MSKWGSGHDCILPTLAGSPSVALSGKEGSGDSYILYTAVTYRFDYCNVLYVELPLEKAWKRQFTAVNILTS